MSAEQLLHASDARGVTTLTLNRPERGNAYGAELLQQLLAQIEHARDDSAVRVLLLRGEGRHFCVGADLAPAAAGATPPAGARPAGLIDVCLALDQLNKPSVALVHGACVGGGVAFAACCDVVLAEQNSFFSIPEVRIGFAPGPLAPFFLRALGARQLRRYGLSGERFSAAEALRLGLVHQLADSDLAAAAEPVIDSLLQGAPGAQTELKQTIARVEHEPVAEPLLRSLQQAFDARKSSDEAIEGRASFAEKRKPRWYRAPL